MFDADRVWRVDFRESRMIFDVKFSETMGNL